MLIFTKIIFPNIMSAASFYLEKKTKMTTLPNQLRKLEHYQFDTISFSGIALATYTRETWKIYRLYLSREEFGLNSTLGVKGKN